MPLIPAPPAAADKDTLALRVDRSLHDQLRAYAEFLGSTKEYIVTSALRRVFRHDKDFIAWQSARHRDDASATDRHAVTSPEGGSEAASVEVSNRMKRQNVGR